VEDCCEPVFTKKEVMKTDKTTKKAVASDSTLGERLIQAINEVNIDEVKLLIEAGAPVNTKNQEGITALMLCALCAAETGKSGFARLLIENGADVNARDIINGDTPLHWSAMHNETDIIRLLIENGADVNARNISEETPLHAAVGLTEKEIASAEKRVWNAIRHAMKMKMNLGDLPPEDNSNLDPHEEFKLIKTVGLLIQAGADVNAKNNKGETAFDIAQGKGLASITDLIRNSMN